MNKLVQTFRRSFFMLLMSSTSAISIGANPAQVPVGVWQEPESGLLVRTHPCKTDQDLLCGTISNVPSGASEVDQFNPDPALRSRHLQGLEIVTDFESVDTSRWQGGGDFGRRPGRIYLPLNGDTLGDHKNRYEIVVEEEQLVVRIAGCSLLSCLAKSIWKRVE